MKITLTLLALTAALLVSHAQPMPIGSQFTGTLTNGMLIESVSNGLIVSETPISTNTSPVIVGTNGVVLPDAFIDAIATATGIPVALVRVLPLKAIVWLFVLAVGVPVVSRWGRKLLPDSIQTGAAGTVLKNLALEINPELTPTPPNVANPKTTLEVVATGQPVAPVTLPTAEQPPITPPKT
jgi:hypothetical protein